MCCSFYGGEGGKSNFDFSRPILPYVNPPWETCECATRKNHVEKRTEWSPWMECHRTNVSIQQSADYYVCRMSCKPLFASEKRCEWQSQPWNRVFHVLHVRLMFFKKLLWDGVCCSVFKKSGVIDACEFILTFEYAMGWTRVSTYVVVFECQRLKLPNGMLCWTLHVQL